MRFEQTTIDFSTRVNDNGPRTTTRLTLTPSDVPDNVVQAALASGQSPRVRMQNELRDNGIPATLTMSWEQFVTPGRAPRIVVRETPAEIGARAKSDPEYLKALLDQLGLATEPEEAEVEEEEEEEEEE